LPKKITKIVKLGKGKAGAGVLTLSREIIKILDVDIGEHVEIWASGPYHIGILQLSAKEREGRTGK
jgi:hypothetical protein